MRQRGGTSAGPLALLLLSSLFAFDVGGATGSQGCLRVHQGDYTFPVKRVVKGAISTRVTAAGTNFITEHIQVLVGALFDMDEQGRAIIPHSKPVGNDFSQLPGCLSSLRACVNSVYTPK